MCRIMPAPSIGGLIPRLNIRTWICDADGALLGVYAPLQFVREVLVLDWLGFAVAVAVPWHRARSIT